MIGKEVVFVLGSRDPEMREIQKTLAAEGRPFFHAAREGVAVNPRSAYDADGVVHLSRSGRSYDAVLPPQQPAAVVECLLRGREPVVRVDHHHPGDPGFEKSPQDYMEGASIGQVLQLLERDPTPTQRLLAAADHCLTAAYQGRCPGVDPDELLFLRASWRARVTARSLTDVIDGILHAAKQVRLQYDSELEESVFRDPTQLPPDLAEGAAYAGRAIRYRDWMREGALKEMLKGASPEHIERFMREHRLAGREVYGNPWRGYAGAYLE